MQGEGSELGRGREIHVNQKQREDGCEPEAGDGWYSLTHVTTSEPGSPPVCLENIHRSWLPDAHFCAPQTDRGP